MYYATSQAQFPTISAFSKSEMQGWAFSGLAETLCKAYFHKQQSWLHSEAVVIAWMQYDNYVKVFSLQDVIKCKRQSDYNRLEQTLKIFSKNRYIHHFHAGRRGLQFLRKHLLTCISFCMEILNLKLFSSIRSLLFWACLLFCSYSTSSLIWWKKHISGSQQTWFLFTFCY